MLSWWARRRVITIIVGQAGAGEADVGVEVADGKCESRLARYVTGGSRARGPGGHSRVRVPKCGNLSRGANPRESEAG